MYTHVASVVMKNYKELFLEHDADCFNAYLADVKSGKKRIATGALLPHENGGGVANLQWQRMVYDIRALGKLSNYVAMCSGACPPYPWTCAWPWAFGDPDVADEHALSDLGVPVTDGAA